MEDRNNPATSSLDHKSMLPTLKKIDDILAGADKIRECGTEYLPQFAKESQASYTARKASAPWRPEFEDALRSLAAKPFTKAVRVNQEAPDEVQGKIIDPKTKERQGGWVDDVDGAGNSLHAFARETFFNGIAYGLEAIYVTYPADKPQGISRADEKALGNRPYWVHVRGEAILQCLFRNVAGRLLPCHVRIQECQIVQDGFAEREVHRIRVLELNAENKPTWQTFIKGTDGNYVKEQPTTLLVGPSEIPIVLFFTGKRSGGYRVKPSMADLADMQLELYRAMSRRDQVLTLAGFPMLKAKGMKPPEPTTMLVSDGKGGEISQTLPAPIIEVGPSVVLFAPPGPEGVETDWDYVQPDANNIKEVREDVNAIMADFRRLAMQPNTPKSGNLVATGYAMEGAKAHSAIEVWAGELKNVLDQAMKYTTQWMSIKDTVTTTVHTDFGVDVQGVPEARALGDMQKRGSLSKQTEREEASRRGLLGPDWSEEEEALRLAKEADTMEEEEEIDPLTGKPVVKKEGDGIEDEPEPAFNGNGNAA